MRNIRSLILLILLLPFFILFIGPLLVLTAWRGRQPLGFITFSTTQYGGFGRIGTLMIGIALWLLVWISLAWVGLTYISPTSRLVRTLFTQPRVSTPAPTPTIAPIPTETPVSSPTPNQPSPTSVLVSIPETPITASPTLVITSPSATTSPIPPTFTPSPLPTFTTIPHPSPSSTTTATPTLPPPTSTPPPPTSSATPVNPPPPIDELTALIIVEAGNTLLKDILTANGDRQQLQTVWRGQALTKAEAFIAEQQQLFNRSLQVEFDNQSLVAISAHSTSNQVVVISQERWTYRDSDTVQEEEFEFIYTLTAAEGEWVISDYTYRTLTPQ